ncbi:hypothetical protein BIZ92_08250 [Achromobacter xylosoxidans]|uniref:Prenyltransferase n=1 Tax=Alcaligenes xylosoxydans xylosoxydans TaxID=85698 RepID=A0A1R1JZQ3_ALCXX|nr:hypothetical protein BIZ92_08250 [Achromobacter xylosoxidans]
MWLFIRVYDELKDAESDLALARAGDKRFIYRPLVTGRVTLADISALRWWMTVFICAINLVFGDWLMAIGLLVGFGYISLAYKWFFYPAMRDNIIFVYFTHLPNVLAIELYTLFVYASEYGMPSLLSSVALLLAPWLTVGAYEFAYKIRLPADETEYMTYSKVLGWRLATWITILLLAISTVCYFVVMHVADIAVWAQCAIAGSSAVAIGACVQLLVVPTRTRANLTRYTGLYWYISTLSITVGAIVAVA